ncbi:MAG: ABC transporter ATP-binding protein [Tenericutes bacterium HGW-Tenericutes-1]|jgi:ATPase subunit of ABC transporter with duplicated ATPase domains|nr:MAG: ABC transporter ATP-binding protein [Tenericutes bacterium HGW-Tenericutes-1]
MLKVQNVELSFGGRKLFSEVNLEFTKGNCYGIIGANGAGKTTFLKILTGEIEPTLGSVWLAPNCRMSILKQNQNAFDQYTVLETVIKGHEKLSKIIEEKEELYNVVDFTDAIGMRLAELEGEFAELDGWNAEANAETLLTGLGIGSSLFHVIMKNLDPKQKVKVLLAQALFGNPEVLLLDEPTNNLDPISARWLETFLLNFENTVLVVSHDRHFLNDVCTDICDVEYGRISLYPGNYDFWYESSQLALRQAKDQNKKSELKIKELEDFIRRFSANKSKAKQATSRKKALDKIVLNDIKPSMRRYPFIDFQPARDPGNDILTVEKLTKPGIFENVSFTISKDQKVAFISSNSLIPTALFRILAGEDTEFTGTYKWGVTITPAFFPQENGKYFKRDLNLVDWVRQYTGMEQSETFIRGWLGRMLFSGEESLKSATVLSGGEKVRCMLIKVMLSGANALLLDDPTNHLDLESITSLNQGMNRFRGNVLFTSHDQELLDTVANRIIVLENTITFDKMCNYEEYLDEIENK